jgi:hypothetical protein
MAFMAARAMQYRLRQTLYAAMPPTETIRPRTFGLLVRSKAQGNEVHRVTASVRQSGGIS